jgi:type IV secretory pathway VirB3-like protein
MTRELLLVVERTARELRLVRLIVGNVALLVVNAVMFVVNALNMRRERRMRQAWQGLE